MPKFNITGSRVEAVSVVIEANDIDEAMEKALTGQFSGREVDVWDSEYQWQYAMLDPDEAFNDFEDSDYGYDY